jgi:hypothetical protein
MIDAVEMLLSSGNVVLDQHVIVLLVCAPVIDACIGIIPIQELRHVLHSATGHLESGKHHSIITDCPVEGSFCIFEGSGRGQQEDVR